jgi:hypothetical protein
MSLISIQSYPLGESFSPVPVKYEHQSNTLKCNGYCELTAIEVCFPFVKGPADKLYSIEWLDDRRMTELETKWSGLNQGTLPSPAWRVSEKMPETPIKMNSIPAETCTKYKS